MRSLLYLIILQQISSNYEAKRIILIHDIGNSKIDHDVAFLTDFPEDIINMKDYVVNINQFHPSDLIAVIKNIDFYEDCVILCRQNQQCFSANYFVNLKLCFFFSRKNLSGNIQTLSIDQTWYIEVADIGKQKGNPTKQKLDNGLSPSTCGKPFFSIELPANRRRRIIDGIEAPFYVTPWMVFIEINEDIQCGGTVIAPNKKDNSSCFILTAAHCFAPYNNNTEPGWNDVYIDAIVRAGNHDIRFSEAHEQISAIEYVVINKKFRVNATADTFGDLAVLKLKKCFEFNHYVSHLCLPDEEITPLHIECYIAGWGCQNVQLLLPEHQSKNEKTGMISSIKRKINCLNPSSVLKIAEVDATEPNKMGIFKSLTNKWSQWTGTPSMGDSGGPLFCKNDDETTFSIFGVSSNIISTAGFFTSTYHWLDAVKKMMNSDLKEVEKVGYIFNAQKMRRENPATKRKCPFSDTEDC